MKAAFEEWRHWLEGATHPFTVLTDHKNLEYLRTAKRLNPRQARWSLFFTRFDFSVTYRPGSKNTKADALSRQFEEEDIPVDPEPILPFQVISQVHCHPSSGHPGITATINQLENRFWWESLHKDTTNYIQQCNSCITNKSSKQSPAGLLQPLPIPQRPWSHIAIDFITDLPNSQGHTTILTIIDRFSKACRLIPLPKLPTALQTAEHLCNWVFRLYGLPEDIVSDRGPQFTSQLWSAFFKALNVNVSLTSGYHPQANGQVERLNQELNRFLRTYCNQNQDDWARYLLWAEYAQNSLLKPSTGLTPFKCVL
uniref:Gypsy retrotransposon integrase-like protein 1 n=1 Tax=Cyprinus carpio carpio TaxID=630221 RepID=A0A9J7YE42_CYPCA